MSDTRTPLDQIMGWFCGRCDHYIVPYIPISNTQLCLVENNININFGQMGSLPTMTLILGEAITMDIVKIDFEGTDEVVFSRVWAEFLRIMRLLQFEIHQQTYVIQMAREQLQLELDVIDQASRSVRTYTF